MQSQYMADVFLPVSGPRTVNVKVTSSGSGRHLNRAKLAHIRGRTHRCTSVQSANMCTQSEMLFRYHGDYEYKEQSTLPDLSITNSH